MISTNEIGFSLSFCFGFLLSSNWCFCFFLSYKCFTFHLLLTYCCTLSSLPSLQGGQKMNRPHSFLFTFSYSSLTFQSHISSKPTSTAGWEGPPYLLRALERAHDQLNDISLLLLFQGWGLRGAAGRKGKCLLAEWKTKILFLNIILWSTTAWPKHRLNAMGYAVGAFSERQGWSNTLIQKWLPRLHPNTLGRCWRAGAQVCACWLLSKCEDTSPFTSGFMKGGGLLARWESPDRRS